MGLGAGLLACGALAWIALRLPWPVQWCLWGAMVTGVLAWWLGGWRQAIRRASVMRSLDAALQRQGWRLLGRFGRTWSFEAPEGSGRLRALCSHDPLRSRIRCSADAACHRLARVRVVRVVEGAAGPRADGLPAHWRIAADAEGLALLRLRAIREGVDAVLSAGPPGRVRVSIGRGRVSLSMVLPRRSCSRVVDALEAFLSVQRALQRAG